MEQELCFFVPRNFEDMVVTQSVILFMMSCNFYTPLFFSLNQFKVII